MLGAGSWVSGPSRCAAHTSCSRQIAALRLPSSMTLSPPGNEQASHGTASARPIEAQKQTPSPQGLPGSLVWLTTGECCRAIGRGVVCKPAGNDPVPQPALLSPMLVLERASSSAATVGPRHTRAETQARRYRRRARTVMEGERRRCSTRTIFPTITTLAGAGPRRLRYLSLSAPSPSDAFASLHPASSFFNNHPVARTQFPRWPLFFHLSHQLFGSLPLCVLQML